MHFTMNSGPTYIVSAPCINLECIINMIINNLGKFHCKVHVKYVKKKEEGKRNLIVVFFFLRLAGKLKSVFSWRLNFEFDQIGLLI